MFIRFLHGLYIFASLLQSVVAVVEGFCVIDDTHFFLIDLEIKVKMGDKQSKT